MSFLTGFESMGQIIARPSFDLEDEPHRIVRINGFPAYVWGTGKPLKFVTCNGDWRTAEHGFKFTAVCYQSTYALGDGDELPVRHGNGSNTVKSGTAFTWKAIDELLDTGHHIAGFAQYKNKTTGKTKWFHVESAHVDEFTDAEYDALHTTVLEVIKMIKEEDELDNEFYPDTLHTVDWDKLAETHAAQIAVNDPLAYTSSESYVIAMKGAASRKNMYREDGHDLAFETDPNTAYAEEAQNLTLAEHLATKAKTPEEAAAAFRAAGWGGSETGHEQARHANPLVTDTAPFVPMAPDAAERSIKRNALPVYKLDAQGNLRVLPSSEQAKVDGRTWYVLPPEKRDAYEAKARAYLKSLAPAEPMPAPAMKPHALAYIPVSRQTAHAMRYAQELLELMGADFDPTMPFSEFDAVKIAAAEKVLEYEKAATRDRRTAWDRYLEPKWIAGLKQLPLGNVVP